MIQLTKKGQELLQKLTAGEIPELQFAALKLGDGTWTQEELASDVTALRNIKLTEPIGTKYAETKNGATTVFISATFQNRNVAETFYVYEVGAYAMDGETEVLYAYDIVPNGTPAQAVIQDQSIPQYIPVSLDIGVSNIDAVHITVTKDLQVVSVDQFQGHTDDYCNPHKTTKAQVGLGNADNTSDMAKPLSTATQNALNGKQPTGDYATNTALNGGLAGKANTNHNHTGIYQPAGSYAAGSHNHTVDNITGILPVAKGGTGNTENRSMYSEFIGTYANSNGSHGNSHKAWIKHSHKSDGRFYLGIGDIVGSSTHETRVDYATNADNADTVDGKHAHEFATSNHNHSGVYQPAGSYAAANHTHPGLNANDYIVSKWQSGTNWYRKWNSGWIEQGGTCPVSGVWQEITMLLVFSNSSYAVFASPNNMVYTGSGWGAPPCAIPISNAKFKVGVYGGDSTLRMCWMACGN